MFKCENFGMWLIASYCTEEKKLTLATALKIDFYKKKIAVEKVEKSWKNRPPLKF